jgi:hypothetical protein
MIDAAVPRARSSPEDPARAAGPADDALARVPINLWPERLARGPARSWRLSGPSPRLRARLLRGSALVIAVALLAGCYALRRPPAIDEAVRVVVMSDEGRLVHAQAYLQRAAGDALVSKLGWRVSPAGSARLELSMQQEVIGPVAKDARDITSRWSVRVRGRALLVCRKGNLTSTYSGVGYATGMADEPEALRAAADNAAFNISTWLETAAKQLR